jgi:hypothetical protein
MTVVSGPGATVALAEDVVVAAEKRPYVDWPSILGGAAIALAMSLLLTVFGIAIGLSIVSPWRGEGVSSETAGIAAAIWFALVNIYAVGLGGYLSGRMQPRVGDAELGEVRFRDGINGLVVWAITLAAGVLVSAWLVSGVARTAGAVAASAANAVGPVAERAVDVALRPSPPAADGAAGGAGAARTGGADRELSPQQRSELTRIVVAALARGQITPEDRAYLEQVVARQTGVSPDVARQRVANAVDNAIVATKTAADKARAATAFGGFWTAVVMLLAAMAAWWGGSLGGSHRDDRAVAVA